MTTNRASNSAQQLFVRKLLPRGHKPREHCTFREADARQLLVCQRDRVIDTTLATAGKNPHFADQLAAIDMAIIDRRLNAAEEACERLLESYPYHGELWLLSATVARLKLRVQRAEIACRTASAYGAAVVRVNHEFALISSGCPEALHYPLRARWVGPAADQSPGRTDVTVLANLAWDRATIADEELLGLLRECRSLDQLFATMINDGRFERAHLDWLNLQGGVGI
jgi:hypothetical protein